MTQDFEEVIRSSFSDLQFNEFKTIMTLGSGDSDLVLARSMAVVANDGAVDLLRGHLLDENGIPSIEESWMVYFDNEPYGEPSNESEAKATFDEMRGRVSEYQEKTTHYMIGNYRYTTDLIDDFEDISTGLHRQNSKLGMARAFLTKALDMDEMVELYHKITSEVYYLSLIHI